MLNSKSLIIAYSAILLFFVGFQSTCFADETVKSDPSGSGGGFFKPVIHLEEEVTRLEQQIVNLIVPIKELQTGTQTLSKYVSGIQDQMPDLLNHLSGTQGEIKLLHTELDSLKQTTAELKDPLIELHDPVLRIQKPLISVDTHVNALGSRFTELDSRFTELDHRFIALDMSFSRLGQRFAELDGRFIELDSRFKELDGRFSALDNRFAVLSKQLSGLHNILRCVFVSIIVCTAIIALGTILVVVVIIRNKLK